MNKLEIGLSKVEKTGEFRSADKAKAKLAWRAYMDELNGTGFRWEFDKKPADMPAFMRRDYFSPNDHFLNLERFQGRVRKFGGFVSILADFQDRPVTLPHPLSRDEKFEGQTLTRNIDETEMSTYRTFHGALMDYSGVLVDHGPSSLQVLRAASNLAQLVNPEDWCAAGYTALPEDTKPLMHFGTRWYLEDVMASVKD